MLVVLGPNGAGKTSTVETLEGYRRPAAGDVRVLGLRPIADHAALDGPHRRHAPARRRVPDARAGARPRPLRRLLPRSPPHGRAARPRRVACRRRHPLAPPLGGRAATPLPGAGAHRAPRRRIPRRADGRGRPRRAHRRPLRGGRTEGEGRLRPADHPRAGRGREDGRPHRDPVVGAHRARGHATRGSPPRAAGPRRSSRSARRPGSTPPRWRLPWAPPPR